ncbi:DUF6783 domain-containing protein [Blautia producta]|uniref:DUF6783 domain-containing protein n=1 Tax=Blautia producta TaxID=33035 RepID=UPI0035BE4357
MSIKFFSFTRVCLKIAFGKLCVTLCGRFGSDEGSVAGYVDRIEAKYAAKWGVQIVGMNFQTHSSTELSLNFFASTVHFSKHHASRCTIWSICPISRWQHTLLLFKR